MNAADFTYALSGDDSERWLTEFENIVEENGSFHRLGVSHFAGFVDFGTTLLVSFDRLDAIRAREDAAPCGWHLLRDTGWSHLSLISRADTWFRDPYVYRYFDRLVDDGFFDEFERVVFVGEGPAGYAAMAFSVASPGATVLAIRPQATLSPRYAVWDRRFMGARRKDFETRYGYAPAMLDGADRAYVFYDPLNNEDAMHAALCARENVALIPFRYTGAAIGLWLRATGISSELLRAAGNGDLTQLDIFTALRKRREHLPYLRALLSHADLRESKFLTGVLCRYVAERTPAPRFRKRLIEIEESGVELPPARGAAPEGE